MEYDFRKGTGGSSSSDSNIPSYGRPSPAVVASHPPYSQSPSLYPMTGGAGAHSFAAAAAHIRNPPFHHAPSPPSSAGVGIRVSIKSDYLITPPPALLPQLGEIPRSNFHFDFNFERNVLAEAVKQNPNWRRVGIEYVPPRAAEPTPSYGSATDPIVSKYIAAGFSREAVPLAVANYGDNPTKVKEFTQGFTLLQEMGFSSNNVAEALIMYDNDTDKALAHFLNSSS